MEGDLFFTAFLLFSVAGLAVHVKKGEGALSWGLLCAGWAGVFLSTGLYGLLVAVACIVAFAFVMQDRGLLAPVVMGVVALLVLSSLVLVPDQWTFLSHFTFMQPLFTDRRPDEVSHFDVIIKQVGFGLFPWVGLLPFAFANWGKSEGKTMAVDRDSGTTLWLFLYFAVPVLLSMLGVIHFGHLFFPAAPAIALGVGVMLARQWDGRRMGGGAAVLLLLMLAILWRELRKDAAPVFHATFLDPAFSADKGGETFPAEVTVGSIFKGAGALAFLSLALFHGQWLTWVRRGLAWLRTGRILHWTIASSFALLILQSVLGLLVRYAEAMNTAPGRKLPRGDRMFSVDLLARPEHLLALGVAIAVVVYALFRETPLREWSLLEGVRNRSKRVWERISDLRFIPWRSAKGFSWTALVLGGLALADSVLRLPFPEGYGVGSTFGDPFVWLLLGGGALLLAPVALPGGLRLPGDSPEARTTWGRIGLGAGMLYVALRVSKEIWFVPPELVVITLLWRGVCPIRSPLVLRTVRSMGGGTDCHSTGLGGLDVVPVPLQMESGGSGDLSSRPQLDDRSRVPPDAIDPAWVFPCPLHRVQRPLGLSSTLDSRFASRTSPQTLSRSRCGFGLGSRGTGSFRSSCCTRGCVWGGRLTPRWQYASCRAMASGV